MPFSAPSATDIATNPTGFWRPPVTKIDKLVIDVLLFEGPQYDFDLTTHPVEGGKEVADQRIKKPIGLVLEGILADVDLSPSAVGANLLTGGSIMQTWEDKHFKLKELKEKTTPFTIVTPLNEYSNMLMVSLRTDRTKDTGEALFFSATFRQVDIVSTNTSFIDADELPKDNKATEVKKEDKPSAEIADKGRKSPEPAGKKLNASTNAVKLTGG